MTLCIPGVFVILDFLRSVIVLGLQSTLRVLTSAWTLLQYMRKLVLQSTVSPLEIGACIVIVDSIEHEGQSVQRVLAIVILFLAGSDWHIPFTVQHHYIVCRFLSSMCMQALFPSSTALICWAFAHPTFGKREHTLDEEQKLRRLAALVARAPTRGDHVDWHAACRDWPEVARQHRVDGKWKNRPLVDIKADLKRILVLRTNALAAATPVDVPADVLSSSSLVDTPRPPSTSTADEGSPMKKAKSIGATEHPVVPAKHTGFTIRQLPETPNDVMS